jgi:DNA-nicking Smr family endonuclease
VSGESDPVSVPIEGTLDLHAFRPRDVPSVVREYVTAAHEAGLREIRLIHGRGTGVQRAVVQRTLGAHPLVQSYRDAPESHLGATVAILARRTAARSGS